MHEPLAQRGPGELQRFLQDARAELHSLDAQLQTAHDHYTEAEEQWLLTYDAAMDVIEDDYAGKRLPGEEVRVSLARRSGGREAYTNYRRAKRLCDRLDQRVSLLKGQISAAQSESKIGVSS